MLKQRFNATDTEFESFIETRKYFFFCFFNHDIGIHKLSIMQRNVVCFYRVRIFLTPLDLISDIETVSELKTLILMFYSSLLFFHSASNCLFMGVRQQCVFHHTKSTLSFELCFLDLPF